MYSHSRREHIESVLAGHFDGSILPNKAKYMQWITIECCVPFLLFFLESFWAIIRSPVHFLPAIIQKGNLALQVKAAGFCKVICRLLIWLFFTLFMNKKSDLFPYLKTNTNRFVNFYWWITIIVFCN